MDGLPVGPVRRSSGEEKPRETPYESLCFWGIAPNVSGLPNPQSWARHLRLCSSANAVTGQGLGGVSVANGAGNPVLAEGQPHRACMDASPVSSDHEVKNR